jgi:hypothetical protein
LKVIDLLGVFNLVLAESVFFIFVFLLHLLVHQFLVLEFNFDLGGINLVFEQGFLLALHLLLIHVVGAPHEELSVTNFAHFAHFNVTWGGLTFLVLTDWADDHT